MDAKGSRNTSRKESFAVGGVRFAVSVNIPEQTSIRLRLFNSIGKELPGTLWLYLARDIGGSRPMAGNNLRVCMRETNSVHIIAAVAVERHIATPSTTQIRSIMTEYILRQ